MFIDLSDGTCNGKLQIVLATNKINLYNVILPYLSKHYIHDTDCIFHLSESISFGDAISVTGQLKQSSHPKQILELVGDSIIIHGNCPTEVYSHDVVFISGEIFLIYSSLTQEFPLKLRQIYPINQLRYEPHIRPKHKIFNSMLRVRSMAVQEVHNFFQVIVSLSRCLSY